MTYARFSGAAPRRRVVRRSAPLAPRRRRPAHTTRAPAPAARSRSDALRQQHRRAGILQHVRQALRGIRRVQRHVGAARLQDAQQRRPPSPASAPGRAPPAPPGPRPARAGGAPAGWRARSAPVGQRSSAEAPPPPRPGVRAACASNSSWQQRSARVRRASVRVPRRQQLRALRVARAAAARDRRALRRRATTRSSSTLQVPDHPLDRGARRTGRCCTRSVPPQPVRRLAAAYSVRSNLRRSRRRAVRTRQRQARAAPALRRGAFCSTNITWNSGVWLRSRSGLQLLHQPLERHVLVRVRAQRRLAHPAPAARGSVGSPDRSVRSTSVLTKKPISPSSSAPRAAGDRACPPPRRPGPRSGDSSAWNAASSTMNSVAPSRAAQRLQRARSSSRGQRERARARRGSVCTARARPVRGQLQQRGRAGQLLASSTRAAAPAPRPAASSRCQTA